MGVGGQKNDNSASKNVDSSYKQLELNLNFPVEEWRDAIYAEIVVKFGTKSPLLWSTEMKTAVSPN
ncbi:MAG: hypothetical protein AAGJ08_08610 [Cyanobacteria bacterium P01_H01_bin.35]